MRPALWHTVWYQPFEKRYCFNRMKVGLPSQNIALGSRLADVQADIPQDSAEITFVPLGMTARLISVSANQ